MADTRANPEHIAIMERCQLALLRLYEAKLADGSISDTGMGNLQRLLMQSGWCLDPSQLSEDLRGKLTDGLPVDMEELPDVLPMRKRA
jgi:hypothetical protein